MRISYHSHYESIKLKKKKVQKQQSNGKFNSSEKIKELKDFNSSNKNLSASLLENTFNYFDENIEKYYYIVEKYDKNYIQESRIRKIICLIEDKIIYFIMIS
jgi:CRISPR/Cas system CSM-associated protein Csm4 (group 5 of RAMP superfamily)